MSPTLATAQSLIDALKQTQAGFLQQLSAEALAARRAGNAALAQDLTRLAIRLSQQNLVLHRARRQLLLRTDLGAITQRLGEVVATARAQSAAIVGVADLMARAAAFIDTLRRLTAVLA